ncbi:uroporphyrinogen-III C-methyltransferase [Candidatus Marinamargulisbacteria bacterium SCGC AG-439-L15]|nr:uroporphyrinogen-III C-methyltransferase [Candidatus Marinamargulisbacteria bacterium SCGC AG-439-L15]
MKTVYLVGAGPGDPELLTIKAKRVIQQADVVLYDYLVHSTCLLYAPQTAELVCVGKKKGAHSKKQEEIHQLMKMYVEKGKCVVRLKGGDPMVFGRAGEEMQFLTSEGLPFQVIPGVSSAVAAATYAGIPLTHRELSRSVSFVTGTLKSGDGISDIHIPDAETLVFLMGITHLEWIVERVLKAGRFTSETPVALIYKGSTSDQQVVIGTLATIVDLQKEAQLGTPTLFVVGPVVSLSKRLNWWECLPLFGRRILLLRTLEQGSDMAAKLADLGAEVIHCPILSFEVKKEAFRDLTKDTMARVTTVVLTSPNGVSLFMEGLFKNGLDTRCLFGKKVIAVGPKTADSLSQCGIIADVVPETYNQEGILSLFEMDLSSEVVLYPSAQNSRMVLSNELKNRGAQVIQVSLYDTYCPELSVIDDIEDALVIFTSASTVTHFYDSSLYQGQSIKAFCLGPVTAAELENYDNTDVYIAKEATQASLIESLITYVSD